MKKFCEAKFREIAEQYGFDIRALKIMDDYINLFIGIGLNHSVSELVRYFKGRSAKEMFDAFEWLKEYKPGEPRF